MRRLRSLWRGMLDVREGERLRTLFMGLYFMLVMFARNIMKPVADSLFLNRFPIERLPYLYILIAVVGGLLAYVYTKIVVKTSLRAAVTAASALCMAGLLVFWWLIDFGSTNLLYAFSVFVSLFGIVFVSQGWLMAANLFDSREAKRLYGVLGLGAIVGAAFGGTFTAFTANTVGSTNLLPAAAVFVGLAYLSLAAAYRATPAAAPRPQPEPPEEAQTEFSLQDMVSAVARYRHLLVIVGIISITYVVEVLVEYQFSAQAKAAYDGDQLTAFLGTFNGVYLSATTFILQFFFTTLVVARFGVGRTLLVAPVSVGVATLGVFAVPGLISVMVNRLVEAATRYSINRTAIELLYLPLPTELKNRTKTFVDVFVDRLGRGVAAVMLLGLTSVGLAHPRQLAFLVAAAAAVWAGLALHARREYLDTVRKRVESRRLDLEGARVTVQDTETVKLLEQVARGSNPRQVIYALSLLEEAAGYDLAPLLEEVVKNPANVVRAKAYELARKIGFPRLTADARADIDKAVSDPSDLAREAVGYVLAMEPDTTSLAAELVNGRNAALAEATLEAISGDRDLVARLISPAWLHDAARNEDPARRALAAFAVGIRGDEGTGVLHDLLKDSDDRVAAAACEAAGKLGNRDYLDVIVEHLASSRLRAPAMESLTSYGEPVLARLGPLLSDSSTPAVIRRQLPRVLSNLPVQASVRLLERNLGALDLTLRSAVLRALSRLRGAAPDLDYDEELVTRQIRGEAEFYYRQYAALHRFQQSGGDGKVVELLTRTIEERLNGTVNRLFRLLGLRFPPKQIYAAYLAVNQRRPEEFSTALEFLDNILEHDLKLYLLPLIDGSPHLLDIGNEVFGIEIPNLESALRQQIRSGDRWLSACAIATAANLRLRALRDVIREAAGEDAEEVTQVAREAMAALA